MRRICWHLKPCLHLIWFLWSGRNTEHRGCSYPPDQPPSCAIAATALRTNNATWSLFACKRAQHGHHWPQVCKGANIIVGSPKLIENGFGRASGEDKRVDNKYKLRMRETKDLPTSSPVETRRTVLAPDANSLHFGVPRYIFISEYHVTFSFQSITLHFHLHSSHLPFCEGHTISWSLCDERQKSIHVITFWMSDAPITYNWIRQRLPVWN